MGCAHGLVLGKDSLYAAFPNDDGLVRGHPSPFIGALDFTGLEEVEDTPAVVGVGVPNGQVANWAGHSVGDEATGSKSLGSVLAAKEPVDELVDGRASGLSTPHEDVTPELRAGIDLALLVLDGDAQVGPRLLTASLGVEEALEPLLLTLDRSEGLGATLGKLRGELGVVERSGTKVVAFHGCT